jgi:hypothetical protein
LVKSKVITDIGGFDENLTMCADWDFYIRVSKSHKIDYIKKILVRKQFHSGSMLDNSHEHINSRDYVFQKHLEDITRYNLVTEANFYKYRDIGMQNCLRGNMTQGRKLFREASKHKLNLTLILMFLLSYLGFSLFRFVAMAKSSFDLHLGKVLDDRI